MGRNGVDRVEDAMLQGYVARKCSFKFLSKDSVQVPCYITEARGVNQVLMIIGSCIVETCRLFEA